MPEPVQLLDSALLRSLVEKAARAPRLRTNYNFHTGMEENPHRFLNAMARGTYIRPHRHLDPPKCESFLALEGEVAFFTFDGAGEITSVHILGRDPIGIDVQPGIWHTLAVLTVHAVIYEVKPGPYSAATDKDFAPWAPGEGQPGVNEYLARLLRRAEEARRERGA